MRGAISGWCSDSFSITAVAWPFVAYLLRVTGFFGWIIAALVGSGAGAMLAQIIRKSVGRRRGRYIRFFTLAGIVIGLLISLLITGTIFGAPLLFFSWQGLLFGVLAIVSAYQLLK